MPTEEIKTSKDKEELNERNQTHQVDNSSKFKGHCEKLVKEGVRKFRAQMEGDLISSRQERERSIERRKEMMRIGKKFEDDLIAKIIKNKAKENEAETQSIQNKTIKKAWGQRDPNINVKQSKIKEKQYGNDVLKEILQKKKILDNKNTINKTKSLKSPDRKNIEIKSNRIQSAQTNKQYNSKMVKGIHKAYENPRDGHSQDKYKELRKPTKQRNFKEESLRYQNSMLREFDKNKRKIAKKIEQETKEKQVQKRTKTMDSLNQLEEFHKQQLNEIKMKNEKTGKRKKMPSWHILSPDSDMNDRLEDVQLADSTKEDNESVELE